MSDETGVKLHNTMDAKIWAEEYRKRFPESDEGAMLTWFANSIMCGWDHAHWRLEPELQALREVEQAAREVDRDGDFNKHADLEDALSHLDEIRKKK